ncbi:MAG: sulfide/dihydroorotate dehydrogenase-like FAD/NAD-binding protein [Fervidobacterium sp.]|jgi:ferredoxin--NADP+ reductase
MTNTSEPQNRIIEKKRLTKGVYEFWISNSFISRRAQPGQFVIIRINDKSERIPLTIAQTDKNNFRIVVKAVGKSTYELCSLEKGFVLNDVVGPLGKSSEIKFYGRVLVIGGGVGIAAVLPIAKALKDVKNRLSVIIGARSNDGLILKDEFEFADKVIETTDDGSSNFKGTVIDAMKVELESEKYDIIWSIGPAPMMKSASEIAKKYNLPIWVSLNSIMIDGTGMCGGCRIILRNSEKDVIKYVCVDGPEFDGRYVDWEIFIKRLNQYRQQEKIALERYLQQVGDISWL